MNRFLKLIALCLLSPLFALSIPFIVFVCIFGDPNNTVSVIDELEKRIVELFLK